MKIKVADLVVETEFYYDFNDNNEQIFFTVSEEEGTEYALFS